MIRSTATGLAVAAVLLACGCVELSRRPVSISATVENPWQVGRAGLPISSARPGGLGGVDYQDAALYRVSKTDTLSGIALRHYGDRRYTYDVYLANGEKIKEAGGLRRGMIIRLPKLEEPTSARVFPARP